MAQNTYKSNTFKSNQGKTPKAKRKLSFSLNMPFLKDRRLQLSVGFFLLLASVFIFLACFSYLFTGKADQSVVEAFFADGETVQSLGQEATNWMKLLGALTAHKLIFSWFGIGSFLIPPFLFLLGYKIVWGKALMNLTRAFVATTFFLVWISLLMGSMIKGDNSVSEWSFYSGGLGYELSQFFDSLLGYGTILFLAFTLLVFVIFYFNITEVLSLKKATVVSETSEDEVKEANGFAGIQMDEDEEADDAEEEEEIDDSEEWIVSIKDEDEDQPVEEEVEE